MKKIVFFLLLLVLITSFLKAQITYGTNDMPTPGDTFRISIATSTAGVNYLLTGNNYTWDFSNLEHPLQNIDTFVSVTTVPAIYQLFFNSIIYPNNRATVAKHQTNSPIPIPVIQINDVYNFFRNTSSFYALVGYGANVNGSDLPIRFTNVDYIYRFPLLQGNVDSCISDFAVTIPSIGYFGETKKRKNTVDGWGTLITPYGTFQTIRVKSELFMHDTLNYNSIGYSQNRTETEYKWLANGFGTPILSVTESQTGVYVQYIDSIRPTIVNLKKDINQDNTVLNVFPNPCKENFSIAYAIKEKSFVNISLFNIEGRLISTIIDSEQMKGDYLYQFNISNAKLSRGIFYIKFTLNNKVFIKKLIIN